VIQEIKYVGAWTSQQTDNKTQHPHCLMCAHMAHVKECFLNYPVMGMLNLHIV